MTIRLRTAALLAASFVLAGAVVLAVGAATYQSAVHQSPEEQTDEILDRLGVSRERAAAYLRAHPDALVSFDEESRGRNGVSVSAAFEDVQRDAQRELLGRSRRSSLAALAVMALMAGLAGWVIAGRVLAPLRMVTERARAASGADLSGRVGLDGRRDEIRELGDTFDDMLERLERTFVAQRRFSSQVSHELRTPLAIIESEAELLRRDAPASQHASLDQIRVATQRAERIIEALLVLARSGSGDVQSVDLRLDLLAGDVLGDLVNGPAWRVVRVDLDLDAAPVRGDRALLERLVSNLLSNAARHNRPDGWVEVRTGVDGAWSTLTVANSTTEPDSTAEPDATGAASPGPSRRGVGLTVVDSVIVAHGGELVWGRPAAGTVTVTVRLPTPGGGNGDGPRRRE